jgi:hypothetical protein
MKAARETRAHISPSDRLIASIAANVVIRAPVGAFEAPNRLGAPLQTAFVAAPAAAVLLHCST